MNYRGRRGRDLMVVGFTITYAIRALMPLLPFWHLLALWYLIPPSTKFQFRSIVLVVETGENLCI